MQTFDLIYNENYRWVVNLIKSKTNNCAEAEELANDVFLKVHEHLSNFDESRNTVLGWIRGFVWNKVIDWYRKRKMDTSSIEGFVDEDGKEFFIVKDDCDIEKEYCFNETVNQAHAIIKLLPQPYKKIATLFYVKDLTYEEIEKKTGLSKGTIKGQLSRARAKMKEQFGVA
jgi:RNA polymerase sigma-70 factor (ECF subfamily)